VRDIDTHDGPGRLAYLIYVADDGEMHNYIRRTYNYDPVSPA